MIHLPKNVNKPSAYTPLKNNLTWEKITFSQVGEKGKKVYVTHLQPPRCCITETSMENNHFETCKRGLKFVRFLKEFFGQCGVVADIMVFFENKKNCACIVVYASFSGATRSLKELNGVPLNGVSISIMKPKQHYFANLYVHKQERQIINLANEIFGFNWNSKVIATTLVDVVKVDRQGIEFQDLYIISCKTVVQININASSTILNKLSVLGTATCECRNQSKIEAIKQSRIESKTRALISAFEKIVVAASNIWINEDLNCENVHASRSKVNVGGNTQRFVIPMLKTNI